MNYNYNIICILKSPKIYIEDTIPAPSFTSALFILMEEKKITESVFLVYCRKSISGDLKLMGRYDGLTVSTFHGARITHVLTTIEDMDYSYTPEGFRRLYIK